MTLSEVASGPVKGELRSGSDFLRLMASAGLAGALVVQPRMGFSDPARMREGLLATKHAAEWVVGTVTVDSYTRVGDELSAVQAIRDRITLNGYPITAYSPHTTRWVLDRIRSDGFPVQVRHGSARPQGITAALVLAGLDATEGGPVSYCLPYGRTPLADSVRNWQETCRFLAELRATGREPHLETFGGCMLGQLCPPGLLVAISVLEALFFRRLGLHSVSLSYAQQTNAEQDEQAVAALRALACELLPDTDWHIVLYTYMGLYPRTAPGAARLLEASADLAVRTGAHRLIVKTEAEAHRIPTVEDNVAALRIAADAARTAAHRPAPRPAVEDNPVHAEARALVHAVLNLREDLGEALLEAFRRGYLDVPYCLHPDNAGRTRSHIDADGRLMWSEIGAMPIRHVVDDPRPPRLTAAGLHEMLSFVQRRFDDALPPGPPRRLPSAAGPAVPSLQPPPSAARPARSEAASGGNTMPFSSSGSGDDPMPTPPASPDKHLSSPATKAVLKVQNRMLTAARAFLAERGFIELLPPVIGPVTDPGSRGSKQVDIDYYGHKYKLMTSAILYKQASLLAFDKIFYIAPNVRLEPLEGAVTHRHLVEFHQIDVEIRDGRREDAMALLEELVAYTVADSARHMAAELTFLERDPDAFRDAAAFDRIGHQEAVTSLIDLGHPQDPGAEIDWQGEEMLSAKASRPFFVVDYPKGSRGFYDREDPGRPGVLRNFDLIAPEGYGELASGSEREHDYATIVTRIRESGENPAKYAWYLDLARRGLPGSAGFGLGLERFTRYVTGCAAVWQASAYPKLPGVVSP
ncbi:amino acid--tRNA ligase-related protein [Streptomyces sp. NPDC049910]|uniref:amino acid--tRNA ligase-related protein n=1 Tax=Streptomyces sp. NPDC049910 TaxID=3155278 RepID=UPI003418AB52